MNRNTGTITEHFWKLWPLLAFVKSRGGRGKEVDPFKNQEQFLSPSDFWKAGVDTTSHPTPNRSWFPGKASGKWLRNLFEDEMSPKTRSPQESGSVLFTCGGQPSEPKWRTTTHLQVRGEVAPRKWNAPNVNIHTEFHYSDCIKRVCACSVRSLASFEIIRCLPHTHTHTHAPALPNTWYKTTERASKLTKQGNKDRQRGPDGRAPSWWMGSGVDRWGVGWLGRRWANYCGQTHTWMRLVFKPLAAPRPSVTKKAPLAPWGQCNSCDAPRMRVQVFSPFRPIFLRHCSEVSIIAAARVRSPSWCRRYPITNSSWVRIRSRSLSSYWSSRMLSDNEQNATCFARPTSCTTVLSSQKPETDRLPTWICLQKFVT